ncbi:MAG TPA: DUF1902 domain-containing protein [Caulobacteraceae bacterium]
MSKGYVIEAIWDAEAGVYFAKSNLPGLNIEAATVQEFVAIVQDVAPDLIAANAPATNRRKEKPRTVRFEADLAFA